MQSSDGLPSMPLPVPIVGQGTSECELYIATTTVDDRGRMSNRSPIRFLGWRPCQRIRLNLIAGVNVLLVADPADDGRTTLESRGYLRLPSEIRWCAQIVAGDRLLAIADRRCSQLIVYPPTVLQRVLQAGSPEAWSGHGQH